MLPAPSPHRELIFNNGLGGFTPDGREYVITLQPGQVTPAPWVNVLANPYFGTVVSESGSAYTWVENCHEFRLTPWNNDPVTDITGEAFYIRDEQTGQFWSPTPLPARGATPYVIRHGFGYSVFEHTENGIVSELTVLCRHGRAGEIRRSETAQYLRASAAAVRHRLLGMGSGRVAPKKPAARPDRSGPQNRRPAGAQSFQYRVCRADCVRRRQRSGAHPHRRSERISRPERQSRQPSSAPNATRLSENGSGLGSLRRGASGFGSARRAGAGNQFPTGCGAQPHRRADLDSPFSADAKPAAAPWKGSGTIGIGRSARFRSKRPILRSTSWPMAGCCIRL